MSDVKRVQLGAMLVAAGFAGQAAAHMYVNFPTYDRGGLYEKSKKNEIAFYDDDAFGPVRFNLGHTCSHASASKVTTNQVVVVIPTGPNLQLVDTRVKHSLCCSFPPMDAGYKELGHASPDANGFDWGLRYASAEPAVSFPNSYEIAGKTTSGEDIPRALIWTGRSPDRNRGDLKATVYFPDIPPESCVTEVQYFFPAAQFCANGESKNEKAMGWLFGPTEQWPKELLGETKVQWAPAALQSRNLTKKPLPDKCGGKGQTIGVYPSKADIDKYLRPVYVDQADDATPQSVNWWIKNH